MVSKCPVTSCEMWSQILFFLKPVIITITVINTIAIIVFLTEFKLFSMISDQTKSLSPSSGPSLYYWGLLVNEGSIILILKKLTMKSFKLSFVLKARIWLFSHGSIFLNNLPFIPIGQLGLPKIKAKFGAGKIWNGCMDYAKD
jgi:hypothetical protein